MDDPRPAKRRAPRRETAPESKDAAYWARRARNNEAARAWREADRLKRAHNLARRTEQLAKNQTLKQELGALHVKLARLRNTGRSRAAAGQDSTAHSNACGSMAGRRESCDTGESPVDAWASLQGWDRLEDWAEHGHAADNCPEDRPAVLVSQGVNCLWASLAWAPLEENRAETPPLGRRPRS
jgi:hypothetical protein